MKHIAAIVPPHRSEAVGRALRAVSELVEPVRTRIRIRVRIGERGDPTACPGDSDV